LVSQTLTEAANVLRNGMDARNRRWKAPRGRMLEGQVDHSQRTTSCLAVELASGSINRTPRGHEASVCASRIPSVKLSSSASDTSFFGLRAAHRVLHLGSPGTKRLRRICGENNNGTALSGPKGLPCLRQADESFPGPSSEWTAMLHLRQVRRRPAARSHSA
jgi:hypothetical protein